MIVAVSGTHGLIGQALVTLLQAQGHTVRPIARRHGEFDWAPLAGADSVVHLAGRNIAARWTAKFQRTMLAERAAGVASLQTALAVLPATQCPRTVVVASAIGYYGATWQPVGEDAPRGQGFPAEICAVLEGSSYPAAVRVVYARLGVVLGRSGGALAKMLPAFRLGLGGRVGPGTQVVSWLSRTDAVRALLHCLTTPSLRGPVNLVAPHPVPQAELAATLGQVLRRPAVLPMPAWAVRLLFGAMGDALLLQSCAVSSARLQASGFAFAHPTVLAALQAELA
ncbi:MAG: TIGR01777 family protein [Alphaproteobacteria bacterium]|jgi:uncharacterized protein (TIGR01777 family)|nr:TIGR01777 family protein [Alphaproteobacteria bacterium]